MRKLTLLMCVGALALTAGAAAADPAADWGQDNTNWSSATGTYTASNFVYDWSEYTWEEGIEDPVDGGNFTVRADIEMWMNLAFDATDIYFHIGQDPGTDPTQTQDVTGWLSSNNGQYLFVSKEGGLPSEEAVSTLVFQNDIGHREGQTAPDIPVTWSLDDGSESGFVEGTYSTGGNAGQLYGFSWLLDDGAVGLHDFTIRCEIVPDRYQPDGYYEMDPVLVASPTL